VIEESRLWCMGGGEGKRAGMHDELTVRSCNPWSPMDVAAYERLKEGAIFAHLLSRPDYQVSENLFFAEANDVVIGFINAVAELGIGRVVLEHGVGSSYKSEVVLERLVDRAMRRARELGAKVAHVSMPATEATQAEILLSLGFGVVRRFYELRLDASSVNIEAAEQSELAYRHLKSGEEELLAWIENRCFMGTWGFNPNTAEYIGWELSTKGDCPDDVILALSEAKVIGYCWTEAKYSQDSSTGKREGRIYMIGVDVGYRGEGLGKKLLREGLLHLRNKGRELIDITVDSQNIVAVTLYRSMGFQLHRETIWYEKFVS
jgi:mycothiol synthase